MLGLYHILWQKKELKNQAKFCSNSQMLPLVEMNRLLSTLEEYHCIFFIVEGEREGTNLVEFNINTVTQLQSSKQHDECHLHAAQKEIAV